MDNQHEYSYSNTSSRIPENASESQASQILGYSVGDIVTPGEYRTSDKSSGGTSADNTPNSTQAPGMTNSGSDMANINAGYSSGNSAANPRDSHQAMMSNVAQAQHLLVSRYDAIKRVFFAHKLNADGTHDQIEVPLAADENYQVVK